MQLKYVGDMPKVSSKGVGFDHTKPDKYQYLQAAVELLEALGYGATESTKHLYKTKDKTLSSDELLTLLKKHINNIDDILKVRDKNAKELVEKLKQRVETNDAINSEDKTVWLKNIEMMRDYYFQYVTNQSAYEAALDALAEEIHIAKVKEVDVPMFKNYGMVLNDLSGVLQRRKSPIDSELIVEKTENGLLGKVKFTHI
jgi:hypothetical protein